MISGTVPQLDGAKMKVLSVRQPWAWAIIYGGKDIENRTWATRYRGPLLIHAAASMRPAEYGDFAEFIAERKLGLMPQLSDLQYGGIIGQVDLVDCVEKSRSPWFGGDYGFVLKNPRPLPFVPFKGQVMLFNVEYPALAAN
jgi:hypothetical protein